MSSEDRYYNSQNISLAMLIFTILTLVYIFTFNGTFISDDEQHLVSASQNLANFGQFTVPQMFGNQRLKGNYDSVEPAQAVLGSLLYRVSLLLGTGGVQTIFLLNIYITALTGVLIFALVRVMGSRDKTALITALAFGLGTMAWPYAETFFRDSLAMFFLTGAILFLLIALSERTSSNVSTLYWIGMFLFFGAGVLTKNTVLATAPAIIFVLIISALQTKSRSRSFKARWGLLSLALILLVPFIIPPQSALYKFSWHYYYNTVLLTQFAQPHTAFWGALAGPLISPGKGIFFYSPVLFLSLPALLLSYKKHWKIHVVAWGSLFSLIIAQALFYDELWWGTVNWGLRYLVPVLPLLMVASSLAIKELWLSGKTWGKFFVITIIVIGILVQLGGLAIPLKTYYQTLSELGSRMLSGPAIWEPRYTAILWHWRLMFKKTPWDFALIRSFSIKPIETTALFIILMFFLFLSVFGISYLLSDSSNKHQAKIGPILLFLVAGLILPLFMLKVYETDSIYYYQRRDFEFATNLIRENTQQEDVAIVQNYNGPLWLYILNHGKLSIPWYSLKNIKNDPISPDNPQDRKVLVERTLALLGSLQDEYNRLWFIYEPAGDNQMLEANWLINYCDALSNWSFNYKHKETRIIICEFGGNME